MKTSLNMIKLFIFYIISTVSSILIHYFNKDLLNVGQDAGAQLGAGLSKIILIPLYIILYIVAISLSVGSLITSLKLTKLETKAIKVIAIIMTVLSIALIGFVVYILIQTIGLF